MPARTPDGALGCSGEAHCSTLPHDVNQGASNSSTLPQDVNQGAAHSSTLPQNGHNGAGTGLPQYVYNGEVAISGISGKMPESENLQEFRDHLMNKEDMVTSDNRRWDVGE